MARKLAGLTGKQVLKALRRKGFEVVRVTGSHHFLRQTSLPRSKVIIAVHGNRELPPGTIKAILIQSGLSAEEFMALL